MKKGTLCAKDRCFHGVTIDVPVEPAYSWNVMRLSIRGPEILGREPLYIGAAGRFVVAF